MGCCPSQKGKPDAPQTIEIKRFTETPSVSNRPEEEMRKPVQPQEEKKKAEEGKHEELMMSILEQAKLVLSEAQNALGRNQITKILLGTLKQIEPTFKVLKENKVVSSPDLLKRLLTLIKELKLCCEESKKNNKKGLKSKKTGKPSKTSAFRETQRSLKQVGDFNDKVTGLIWELKKPIEKVFEEGAEQRRNDERTKEIAKELEGVIQSLEDNRVEVVGLCQNDLTNEEAFAFWMESFPTRYMVPIEEFTVVFKKWLKEKKQVDLSEENMAVVVRLVNEATSKKDNDISAKELNTFFENLPYDIDWTRLSEVEKEVADEQRQRVEEVDKMRKENEFLLAKRVEEVKRKESEEEKSLSNDSNLIRFFVKSAWTLQNIGSDEPVRREFTVRNVFVNAKNGDILCFGSEENGDEFKITGTMSYSGGLDLEKTCSGKDPIKIEGNLAENYLDGTLALMSGNGELAICLDVDHWFGYYLQHEAATDMFVCFKRVGNQMTGVSVDEVGAAFWSGVITETELHMAKQYVLQHLVKYDGFIKKSGVVTEIRGKWDIKGYTGGFFLSHNDEQS